MLLPWHAVGQPGTEMLMHMGYSSRIECTFQGAGRLRLYGSGEGCYHIHAVCHLCWPGTVFLFLTLTSAVRTPYTDLFTVLQDAFASFVCSVRWTAIGTWRQVQEHLLLYLASY